ncbi:MAG: cupin domain-containing protein [Hyphomicrobium sp.]
MARSGHANEDLTADEVIALLGLAPHPEGGFFRETFRDDAANGGEMRDRAASTAIYFLLRSGEVSRWHRVDAAEVWHYYAGHPLVLDIAPTGEAATSIRLGPHLAAGERPQAIVPGGHWQRARSAGQWTLVGCTVAPGFEFSGFEIADDDFEPGR